jgi:hypothetical protein
MRKTKNRRAALAGCVFRVTKVLELKENKQHIELIQLKAIIKSDEQDQGGRRLSLNLTQTV